MSENDRARPVTAGWLAAQLAEHPDAEVVVMVPPVWKVIGVLHLGNEDGPMQEPHGVFLLAAVDLGPLDPEEAS